MGVYLETLYSDDPTYEVYFRESALEEKYFEHQALLDDDIYTEADEEGNDSKKEGVIGAMIRRIKEFIQSVKDKIAGFFTAIKNGTGEHITPDMYIKSGAAQVRIDGDIKKITQHIEEEILAERKAVQAISKGISKFSGKTGLPIDKLIDTKAVGNAVDKVNDFVVNGAGTVVSAAVATGLSTALSKYILEGKGITEEIDKLTDHFENRQKAVHLQRVRDYTDGNHKILKLIEQVTFATSKTVSRAEKYYYNLTKPISKYNNIYAKAKEKKIKKEVRHEKVQSIKNKFKKG